MFVLGLFAAFELVFVLRLVAGLELVFVLRLVAWFELVFVLRLVAGLELVFVLTTLDTPRVDGHALKHCFIHVFNSVVLNLLNTFLLWSFMVLLFLS